MKLNQSNNTLQISFKTKVEITNSHPKLKPPISLKSVRNTINLVMKQENCFNYYIFVNILRNKDIKALNSAYLKHNYPTDIITFTYTKGKLIEGELLLGIDEINKNSCLYKTSFKNEFLRVVIHGCLHLLGFTDRTKKEKELMTEKEDFYLSKIKKYVS